MRLQTLTFFALGSSHLSGDQAQLQLQRALFARAQRCRQFTRWRWPRPLAGAVAAPRPLPRASAPLARPCRFLPSLRLRRTLLAAAAARRGARRPFPYACALRASATQPEKEFSARGR